MHLSHPLRVRGLKSYIFQVSSDDVKVAPFTGAWIEIYYIHNKPLYYSVAPFTGAWIEIVCVGNLLIRYSSHPLRVRGLKLMGLL